MTRAITSGLQEAFAWTLNTSFSALVLIGLIVLVEILFRKALPVRWRYVLWLCVLLRLMMPIAPASSMSIFNAKKLLTTAQSPPSPLPTSRPEIDKAVLSLPAERPDAIRADSGNTGPASTPARVSVFELASYLWVLGAAGYLLIVVFHHLKVAAWLNAQQPLGNVRWASLIEETKAKLRLREAIEVFESNRLQAPSLFGFFKPRLVLPKSIIQSLSDGELRLIVLHELIHLKRRDVLLNWVMIFVQAIHWFNPFVWLALRRLRSERELVCDAAVMTHLAQEERKAYGATLIKLVDDFSDAPLTPSVVPIINRKNQMHRRISMIANFKPTTRFVSIGSAIVVLTVVCLTFTTATEKAPPAAAQVIDQPPISSNAKGRMGTGNRLDALQKMIEEQRDLVKNKQAELEARTRDLPALDRETLRKYETLRVEVHADYTQVTALYNYLTNLNRSDLRKAIATASPDPQLSNLFEQLSTTEQKLSVLLDNYGKDHPEVKSAVRLDEVISMQVNNRLDGVLAGLQAKAFALKARMRSIDEEIEKAKEADYKTTVLQKTSMEGKRELDSMQQALDRMQARLVEEKINAVLGHPALREP